jgi:hypothetical protein
MTDASDNVDTYGHKLVTAAIIAIAAIFSIVAAVGALALFVDMLGWSRLGTLTCLCTTNARASCFAVL